MDEKIENSQNYEQIPTIQEIEFEIEYKSFKFNMEKVSSYMMNFWASLQEPIVGKT